MNFLLILCTLLPLFAQVQSQKNAERDSAPERMFVGRVTNPKFSAKYGQGRCPRYFYQLGEECVFFANDGKIYSWQQVERICAGRILRMIEDFSSSNPDQPNSVPKTGVRPLVLNTPEKTEILRAYKENYGEHNFAVRLPPDYNTLRRCHDGQDDKWPHYCQSNVDPNATCFETFSNVPNDFCLRQVECEPRYLRLACEFTLAGSPEITSSQFRNCPKSRSSNRRFPIWAWILLSVGIALLIFLILVAILTAIRKSKGSSKRKAQFPSPTPGPEKIIRIPASRQDRADEPMIRKKPSPEIDTGYLQPTSSDRPIDPKTDSNDAV